MALLHLSEEQIRTWTRAQKDQWWFDNVYRGDMPQLTVRSGITGFLLGGVLSATALYIAAKTGIIIGVGLTSVILSFAIYRILHGVGLARDYTLLENNCTQSIATAAGYMVSGLIAGLSAYMLVTGTVIPWWHMVSWLVVVCITGVLLAFPLKRRFINEDQLPFPEGRACGVVLDALYTGGAEAGMFRARLLGYTALLSGFYQFIMGDGWMNLLQFKILRMNEWAGLKEPWSLPERLDTYYYDAAARLHWWIPQILGTDIRQLGLRLNLDAALAGVGGLIGIRVASSIMIGATVNFVILAPLMIQHGDIVDRVLPGGKVVPISRSEIVNQWSLWWGVAMMVVGSLVGLLARPEIFAAAFNTLRGNKKTPAVPQADPLKHIEVPLWISYVGVPVFAVLGALVSNQFFGVPWLLAFVSLPLIFVLAIICTNSMALTSWTPTGALAKITQFTMGAIDHTNPASNLIPAAMTAEISNNAANLLSDIKPGYMLGGKPRHQVLGHIIGIFSGALFSVPLFFLLFLPPDHDGVRSTATIVSEHFAMPAALQWKGVAEIIAKGVSNLAATALIAAIVAAIFAAVFEIARIRTKGRFPLSAVSIGLGVILPPEASFAMWIGAVVFWWMGRTNPAPGTRGNRFWVEGSESICAGLISGAALVGIGNAIVNVLLD
jgi:OPT family oligopeptide transporter